MFQLLKWMPSSSSLDSSTSLDSPTSSQGSSRGRREQNRGGYFRAIRWILLLSLVLMAFMSLTIFTEDVRISGAKWQALLVVMSSLALATLGLFSVLNVRVHYVAMFSLL